MIRKNLIYAFLILFLCTMLTHAQKEKPYYTVGIMYNLFSEVNLNDAEAACEIWIKEIGKPWKNDFDVSAKIFKNFDEVASSIKNDNITVLALGINEFLMYKDKFNLKAVLVPSFQGETDFKHLLLVRNEGNFKNINDLKGKDISISTNYDPVSARIWFETICAKNKIKDEKKFFNKITEVSKESQLIMDLFFGKIDACIIREKSFILMNELNPQIGERLSALESSPAYLIAVICFSKNFTNDLHRKYFMESALDIHKTTSGKQLMTLMKIDKLVPYNDDYLNTYKELLNEYKHRYSKK
jgi:ABC-type phosphate/phosphonate transport system substrate-binding protein